MNNKLGSVLNKEITNEIVRSFNDFLPKLIDTYLDTYDNTLRSSVIDKNSLANPEYFYDDYAQALRDFKYLSLQDDGISISIPTEDTFNFKGRLSFIEVLTHGIVGSYLELPQTDYDILKSNKNMDDKIKKFIKDLPSFSDSSTPKELSFYLIPEKNQLYKIIEELLGKTLVNFPFSNASPINIFEDGVKFFEDNLDNLLNTSIDDSIKVVERSTY